MGDSGERSKGRTAFCLQKLSGFAFSTSDAGIRMTCVPAGCLSQNLVAIFWPKASYSFMGLASIHAFSLCTPKSLFAHLSPSKPQATCQVAELFGPLPKILREALSLALAKS